MAFPTSWPPRAPSGTRSIRFYVTGTTTATFSDNAFMFASATGANPYTPLPVVPPGSTAPVSVPATPWGTGQDANPNPLGGSTASTPMIWCRAFIIHNTGASALEFSFDGNNVHGVVKANSDAVYFDRFEAGIAVRGAGGTGTFVIEAW